MSRNKVVNRIFCTILKKVSSYMYNLLSQLVGLKDMGVTQTEIKTPAAIRAILDIIIIRVILRLVFSVEIIFSSSAFFIFDVFITKTISAKGRTIAPMDTRIAEHIFISDPVVNNTVSDCSEI